jgi:hypothetical protein
MVRNPYYLIAKSALLTPLVTQIGRPRSVSGSAGSHSPGIPVVSMGHRNTGLKFTCRSLKAQSLSRTLI